MCECALCVQALCRWMPPELWFTPHMLLSEVESRGLRLGIVIDLTFTARYYQRKVLL